MKKLLILFLLAAAGFTTNAKWVKWTDKTSPFPSPAKYESFENGVPKTWTLQGNGKLSINPYHYKLGKKSLQWDFKANDVIKINNTIGEPYRRGLRNNACFSCFGIWIYVTQPMKDKNLRIEFYTDNNKTAHFDFTLNYCGWQQGVVSYKSKKDYLTGSVSRKTNNIRIKAPKDIDGQVLIDLVVYNGPRYYMFLNVLPNKSPWKAPDIDKKLYPVPEKVSAHDMKAIKKIESSLFSPEIRKGCSAAFSKNAMQIIKDLDIVEDEHGIRGRPVNLGRNHGGGEYRFYTCNGIPAGELLGYKFLPSSLDGDRAYYKKTILNGIFRGVQGSNKLQFQSQSDYDDYCDANVRLWKYLIDQGLNTSYGDGHYYAGTYISTTRGIYVVRDALFKSGLMPQLFEYVQYKLYPFFEELNKLPTMDYFSNREVLFYGTFLRSNEPAKQLQALRFISKRLSREITADNGFLGFKEDGCGLHAEGGLPVDYLKGGIAGIAKVAYLMSDSSFALSDQAFEILKRVALRMYFYSSNLEVPLFMQGTSVFGPSWKATVFQLPRILKHLALAGKSGCDRELAQAYVNVNPRDTAFAQKYNVKPSTPPQGNISMPYAPLVAQRRNDWVAVAWGSGVDMRARGNHYGYAMWNGPLTILGRDGLKASGTVKAGWDWNRPGGATALYIPELTGIKYKHSGNKVLAENAAGCKAVARWYKKFKKTNARETYCSTIHIGNGGISWRGKNGCFRKIFKTDTRLLLPVRGIKSYFFINDRIYALGSNLTSHSKKYHLQTSLYQKALVKKDIPTFIDGREIKTFPVTDKALDAGKAHYLIDPVGNGYFIPANQQVFVARKEQKSRITKYSRHKDSTGDYATAWLEHGIECKDAKYAYVIMPYCDKEKFAEFNAKDYEILRQDEFAHILHDKIDGFYAGIFFKGGNVSKLPHIKNVERDCQIMYLEKNGKLEIAVGDPATHRKADKTAAKFGSYGGKSELVPLKVAFAGSWKLESPVDGIKILNTGKKTIIEFACIHGRDFNFTLIK